MVWRLSVLAAFLFSAAAQACPWCKTNILQKPTVLAGEADPGGKFFGNIPDPKLTRHYYIAAEPVSWDYVPLHRDPVTQSPLVPPASQWPTSAKLRYVQYTDQTFTTRAVPSDRLGILGPVLRGVTGEFLAVTLLNRADRPLSMHPHGVKYDKDSEGAAYFPNPGRGAAIAPDARFTYVWKLDETAGPRAKDQSSKAWLYHSHVLADQEVNAGLIGFIVVTDPQRARANGTPADVDREMAALFMMFDESTPEEDETDRLGAKPPPGSANDLLPKLIEYTEKSRNREVGARHTINGLSFGNLSGLDMNEGEKVRWYVLSLGSERDAHTAHWHGTRVIDENGRSADVIEMLPGTIKVADMLADNPGPWLLHCHIADHMMEGMYAPFFIHPRTSGTNAPLGRAFFNANRNSESIRVTAAQVKMDFTPYASMPAQIKITGQYSVLNIPQFTGRMLLDLGGRKIGVPVNSNGKGEEGGANVSFKVARAGGGRLGAIIGFEVNLSGSSWVQTLQQLGIGNATTPAEGIQLIIPFQLSLNESHYRGSLAMRYHAEKNGIGQGVAE